MFIVDTFKFYDEDGKQLPVVKEEQIGGGGTYFIVGARHFLPAQELAQIVDTEPSSCSPKMLADLKSYGEDMFWFRLRQDGKPTALGLNAYTGQGRDFSMPVAGVRLWPMDLVQSPSFFQPTKPCIIHSTCSPERAAVIIEQIDEVRSEENASDWKPAFIWEILPVRPDCIPEKMLLIAEICPRLSVLSPNHTEALAMFGKISSPYLSDHQVSAFYPSTDGMKAEIENVAKSLLQLLVAKDTPTPGPGWDRGVIVRCGAMGCCIVRKRYLVSGDDDDKSEEAKPQWIEAYWTASASPDFRNHIVDVTGGGNAFLGGLAAGMKLTDGDLRESALYGTVSASYAIEQDGLPHIETTRDGVEVWNGDLPSSRLQNLRSRTSSSSVR
ncbi:hypothetical protein QFC24_001309 [Naganishia onofrii]|uniref:Uncharacterized protein n=1 Tax=Naganishia onofrii TaxID=1851511 RepID=A0ACC2XSQ5_9TREE|nr:hypothetical protein QFC24_001309 [Naganishia onofrii]